MNFDWLQQGMNFVHGLQDSPYAGSATSPSISANRISFGLGLMGPSLTVDTACSASLVALNLSIGQIRQQQCSSAISCSAGMHLFVLSFVAACSARMLSTKGRCATFDASANGYVRGEGGGALVITKQQTAATCIASISGSAVNQDGRTASLTAPNGPAQQAVIRASLRDGGLHARDLSFSECHGTGTALGDPIEVGALGAVQNRLNRLQPITIAAVKTYIGHLETSAGTAGLITCIVLMAQGVGHPNIHLRHLNPHIEGAAFPGIIPTECVRL
jgi:acyl transferase domain-containing protein